MVLGVGLSAEPPAPCVRSLPVTAAPEPVGVDTMAGSGGLVPPNVNRYRATDRDEGPPG